MMVFDGRHALSFSQFQQWALTDTATMRLLLACGLGGIIGLDREYHHKPSGVRTNLLICFGARAAGGPPTPGLGSLSTRGRWAPPAFRNGQERSLLLARCRGKYDEETGRLAACRAESCRSCNGSRRHPGQGLVAFRLCATLAHACACKPYG